MTTANAIDGKAGDENGDKMYTLHYRGFHVVFSEPLTAEEEIIFKTFLDYKREDQATK